MTPAAWEALCDGCGHCCRLPGTLVACPGLDTATNRCRTYANRTAAEVCVKVTPQNVAELRARGTLPDTCGYVRHVVFGVPRKKAKLEFMRGTAQMLPYGEAPEWLKAEYERQKAAWFNQGRASPQRIDQRSSSSLVPETGTGGQGSTTGH